MGFKEEVLAKLDKIETKISEQTINLALNNKVLEEHHKRSTQLEMRMNPLEDSHMFVNRLSKVVAAAVALVAGLAAIYHYLLIK